MGVEDEGGGEENAPKYSDKVKVNVRRESRLRRNVLEINLENDEAGQVKLDNETIAKLLKKIGIDLKTETVGVQVCPGYSNKIFVWLKDNVNIDRFCKDETIRVNGSVKTGLIKPMGRREVAVTIRGLNFNTPDGLVIDYLNISMARS